MYFQTAMLLERLMSLGNKDANLTALTFWGRLLEPKNTSETLKKVIDNVLLMEKTYYCAVTRPRRCRRGLDLCSPLEGNEFTDITNRSLETRRSKDPVR